MYRIKHIPTGKYFSATNQRYRILWWDNRNQDYVKKFLIGGLSKTGKTYAKLLRGKYGVGILSILDRLNKIRPGEFEIESLVPEFK